MTRWPVGGLLVAVALAGCGSSGHGKAEKHLIVPAYGGYRATTIAVTQGTRVLCQRDARTFADDAVSFLHASVTPPDDYFFRARLQFVDFRAHLCDVAILRTALDRRLTLGQRRALVARFSFLSKFGRGLRSL
jgi:hypothetical protein